MKKFILSLLTLMLVASSTQAASSDFSVDLSKSVSSMKVDENGTIHLVIKALNEAHINEQAAIKISFAPSDAIKLQKTELNRDDNKGSKDIAEFDVAITAIKAGDHVLTGKMRFILCSPQWCKPINETFSHAISIHGQTSTGKEPGNISNLAGN